MQLGIDKTYYLIILIGLKSFVASELLQQSVQQDIANTTPLPDEIKGVSNQQENVEVRCKSPDLLDGSCKPLTECPSLVTRLLSTPDDPTFRQYLKISNVVCSGEYAVICCPDVNQEKNIKIPILPINSDEIPTKLPTMADGCGNVDRVFRKLVGYMSNVGDWPWIALIGYNDGVSESSFKCGGVLITSRHVLTAAHCIRSDLKFVRLGEHDLSTDAETTHIDVPVVKNLSHPNYNGTYGYNDIALLYLGQNVKFSERITPICVPIGQELRSKNLTKYNPFIAGWGRFVDDGKPTTILQELQVEIYGNDICKDLYADQRKYILDEEFDNSVYCAGYGLVDNKDTCQRDSGGPLMFPEVYEKSFRFHVIGIGSQSIDCTSHRNVGWYSRVTYFIEWIEKAVGDTPEILRNV